jgi:uncharacterized protein YndB with AHSA1/START domain
MGASPQDPGMLRIQHARVSLEFNTPPDLFFNAYSRWAGYEYWAPDFQGASHWLVIRQGGTGSQFVLYDKPGGRNLVQFGTVTEVDRNRRFAWRAPFSEWSRAFIRTILEIEPTSSGGSRVTETLYVDAREDHLPVVAGFMGLSGYDSAAMEVFLEARLSGLDRLIRSNALNQKELDYLFTGNRVVAADWSGRISEGEWVRILYSDGELDFDAPPQVVFNAFTRFARYADWTRMIHVGCEWLDVRAGGVGSRFLLWEKPGGRQVIRYAVITELERNKKFAWRAPMSEWGKVFIGTSMQSMPRPDGGTHVYHILYVDLPVEYLPVFSGFGTLHGFDMEFETFHIHEEARGFNILLTSGALTLEDKAYFFTENRLLARDWPMQDGRPWPEATLTLKPDRVITYEQMLVEMSEILADAIPSPGFMRRHRDLARTYKFNQEVLCEGA